MPSCDINPKKEDTHWWYKPSTARFLLLTPLHLGCILRCFRSKSKETPEEHMNRSIDHNSFFSASKLIQRHARCTRESVHTSHFVHFVLQRCRTNRNTRPKHSAIGPYITPVSAALQICTKDTPEALKNRSTCHICSLPVSLFDAFNTIHSILPQICFEDTPEALERSDTKDL